MKITFKSTFTCLLLVLGTLLACSNETETEEVPHNGIKMILDLDTGIDDAMALAYAVQHPEIELLGIVGSYGNASLDQGLKNSLNLLNLLGRTDVPVYAGCPHSLSSQVTYIPDEVTKEFHGENGIGGIHLPTSERKIEKEDGIDYLIRMADTYGKELIIVAVGPLTNLAKAMDRDKSFEQKIGKIVIMGGALMVPGNMNHYAEANIFNDPIAARRVLKSQASIIMVGLDVTYRTILTKKETNQWRLLQTPSALAYADMVDFYIDACNRFEPELNGCALHDPLAVAVALDSTLVQTFNMFMEVGTSEDDFGRTIGDKAKLLDRNPNVSVCINVDQKRFNKRFFESLYNLFSNLH